MTNLSRFCRRCCAFHCHHPSDVRSLQRTLLNTNATRFFRHETRNWRIQGVCSPLLSCGGYSPYRQSFDVPSLQHTLCKANTTDTEPSKHWPSRTSTAWRNIARCETPCSNHQPCVFSLPLRQVHSMKLATTQTEQGEAGHRARFSGLPPIRSVMEPLACLCQPLAMTVLSRYE
jgi:hypothetical protein